MSTYKIEYDIDKKDFVRHNSIAIKIIKEIIAMIYRTEHPKPQFERASWQNLNGKWAFEIDHGNSGEARGLQEKSAVLSGEINVPFCPESKLSGIEHKDFMCSVWYKREFNVTKEQTQGLIRLHFGAVDYKATVYVNGCLCGTHKGGYVSFFVDVTPYVCEGENVVTVHAEDFTLSHKIPSGKQSDKYASYGGLYTRTTGIWQTVWLEFLPKTHIEKVKFYPEPDTSSLSVSATLCGKGELTAEAFFEGRSVGKTVVSTQGGVVNFAVALTEKHLWEVGNGNLYDLKLTFGKDVVKSYFGLRKVRLDGYKFMINDKSVFQRLVLDQGFYPDGLYTAPTDKELENDVLRSLAMGFNGARLHEKIFEERFLYYCDKHGYIVWGEYPDWGLDCSDSNNVYYLLPEWLEEIERDFNHPSIIGWCPRNEAWVSAEGKRRDASSIAIIYDATKAVDCTRPCIDVSGGYHIKTDIFDWHSYEQDPERFAQSLAKLPEDGAVVDGLVKYKNGQPFFLSEYGGIGWGVKSGWGYGNAPETEEEFLKRLKGLTDVLLDHPYCFGLCYTQLTDIEQEQNGLYTYDRQEKFPSPVIKKIFSRKAKIEE